MKHVDIPPNLRDQPGDGFEVYITTSIVADNAICSKQIHLRFNKVAILLDNEKELEKISNRILNALETLKSRVAPGQARVFPAESVKTNEENMS